ncbi:MAG TPA: pilin [Candidatus Saccharimonadia bacterium]|nr:pilin [Candidatus Saccharimonadia bacterium]
MVEPIHVVAALTKVCGSSGGCGLPTSAASHSAVQTILSIVFGLVGALALLMITLSGLRYITSAGNPDKAGKAREALIYSLVGLAIALTAEAIVNFVVNRV